MKKINRVITVFALALMAVMAFSAFSEGGVIFGLGPDEAYTELTDAFDFAQYDEAREVLKEHPELLSMGYGDSVKYNTYLEALSYLEAGDYYVASQLFESLKDFRNSLVMAYYSAGRNAEHKGEYEDAEAFYRECATYADAKDRMIACGKMKVEALSAEADNLYAKGVGEKSISDLESAYDIYISLGDNYKDRAEMCLDKIAVIEKKEEYDNAVSDFESAVKENNEQRLKELKAYFDKLGNYENSAEYALRAAAIIENMNRTLAVEAADITENGFTVKITDTVTGDCEYELSYASVNAPVGTVFTVSEKTLAVTDLVPSTEYTVTVAVKGTDEFTAETTVKTKPAQLFDDNGFTVSRSYLLGLKRSYLNKRTFEEIWLNYGNNFERFDDFAFSPEDTYLKLQKSVYPYLVSYKADAPFEENAAIRWVIRTKSAGVYVYDMPEETALAQSGIIYLYLENIMDPMYEDLGAWPRESMTVEMYINGKLASQGFVTVNQN